MSRKIAKRSDESLIRDAAAGDGAAFAELYDRYSRVAYSLALRIVRDRRLAEDAVQEAFLAIWRSPGRYDPSRARPGTWVLTFVHRRAVDLVRREQRRRADVLTEADLDSIQDGPAEALTLRLERRRVREALRELSDDQRAALELAYFGGYTQTEVAEVLGEPLGTIKSRMFTGLARLRDLLGDAPLESSLEPDGGR